MEFNTLRFSDFCELYSGGDAPDDVCKSRTADYPFPIFSNGIDSEGLYGFGKKSTMPAHCLTISARGTVGKVFYRKEPFLPIVRLITIVPHNEKVHSLYLYYLLRCIPIDGFGTSQQQITIPYLYKKKIRMVGNLLIQERIASILSEYDSLIEANNKRIKILEQMAENLYKEWFVRFRFPGHETAEFENGRLGKIPKDFKIVKMQDVLDYYVGGGWGNDEEDTEFSKAAYVIRGTDFPAVEKGDISSCPYRYHKPSNFNSRKLEAEDIILEVSGGTAEQPVGRTVYVDESLVDRFDGNVICASFCKQIRLKKDVISPIYFYYWMQFLYDTRIIERFQLQSTGIINFKFEYFLKKGDVMLPPKELMIAFEQKVLTFRAEIMTVAKQNENLIKQRDLLLPRLMSGKLEV